jgi:phasin family protein
MANSRHQERSFESSAAQVEYKVGEEATRATRDIADFNKRAARTNVDMLRSGMETARHLGVEAELTSSLAKRSTDQFGRALGLADVTPEQASRNLSAIMQISQALNEGVRKVSDEWFKFARARIERAFEHVDKAMRSRTPQELAAIQTEAVRDNLESMLQSTRRIAELSQQTANEASHASYQKQWAERPSPPAAVRFSRN